MKIRSRSPSPEAPARRRRPWAVRVTGWLLLVEAVGLIVAATAYLEPFLAAGPVTLPRILAEPGYVATGAVFAVLAAVAAVSFAGFLRLAPATWLSAMLVQGGGLGLALVLYFRSRPPYTYPMMIYCIIMVLYLVHGDVTAAFRLNQPAAGLETRQ